MKSESLRKGQRAVIKVGTSLIADGPKLRKRFISDLARQIAGLHEAGIDVALVSSGAVGTGMGIMNLSRRPALIQEHQAVASIGQARLMEIYRQLFEPYAIRLGQILLTRDDLSNRRRHLNARNTIEQLFAWRALPIINENDTVMTEELKFGDNDQLAALVSSMIDADCLIILTDVDGVLDRQGHVIPDVPVVTRELKALAGGAGSVTSRGGMISKIEACAMVTASGIAAYIVNGNRADIISQISGGRCPGTFFPAAAARVGGRPCRLPGRKRWIAHHVRKTGSITVDDGAAGVLRTAGKSLLPSGIVAVTGRFNGGDAVEIVDRSGVVIGAGITQYSAVEINAIKGRHSREITKMLGYTAGSEIIHRDDLVIVGTGPWYPSLPGSRAGETDS